ncbi:MAG: transketolase family protein [Athalassotoga sp.]
MRKAFVRKLTELTLINKDIYLLTGDLGFSVFDEFKERFPNNFINMGVSEANMIGTAAGMAMRGKQVFVYSIIPFVTFRVLEQIRNDLCLQKLPVKIVGVGEGITYGTSGPTHHSIEDIGVMSSLPNMKVISPADPIEVEELVEQTLDLDSPCYIRLGKSGEENVNSPDVNLKIGKGNVLRKGKDIAIISTGNMVSTSLKVSEELEKAGIDPMVVSMHTIKPLDEALLKQIAEKFEHLIVIEEHIYSCGLGSRIAFYYSQENIKIKTKYIGLPDKFVDAVGKQDFLRSKYGLDPESIKSEILSFVK